MSASQEPRGIEAEVFLVGDDDVVDDIDPQQEAAHGEALRELQIQAAWSRIPGEVIMHDGDGRGSA